MQYQEVRRQQRRCECSRPLAACVHNPSGEFISSVSGSPESRRTSPSLTGCTLHHRPAATKHACTSCDLCQPDHNFLFVGVSFLSHRPAEGQTFGTVSLRQSLECIPLPVVSRAEQRRVEGTYWNLSVVCSLSGLQNSLSSCSCDSSAMLCHV